MQYEQHAHYPFEVRLVQLQQQVRRPSDLGRSIGKCKFAHERRQYVHHRGCFYTVYVESEETLLVGSSRKYYAQFT